MGDANDDPEPPSRVTSGAPRTPRQPSPLAILTRCGRQARARILRAGPPPERPGAPWRVDMIAMRRWFPAAAWLAAFFVAACGRAADPATTPDDRRVGQAPAASSSAMPVRATIQADAAVPTSSAPALPAATDVVAATTAAPDAGGGPGPAQAAGDRDDTGPDATPGQPPGTPTSDTAAPASDTAATPSWRGSPARSSSTTARTTAPCRWRTPSACTRRCRRRAGLPSCSSTTVTTTTWRATSAPPCNGPWPSSTST